MYEVLDGFDERTVAVRAVGKVTADDYREVLTPAVERATAGGRKARLYIELGSDFEGYDAGALIADAGIGLGHFGSFERIAVVTDMHWIKDAMGLFGGLIPGEVRTFPVADAAAAREWMGGSLPA